MICRIVNNTTVQCVDTQATYKVDAKRIRPGNLVKCEIIDGQCVILDDCTSEYLLSEFEEMLS